LKFRYDINGLRAIAVSGVVLFHFNPSWLPGGFSGVDVFFVISGFLMTGLIFRGLSTNHFSILKFYISRANRIIPALAVLCITLLIFGWYCLLPNEYTTLKKHIIGSISFFSNFVYWGESGYFDASSHEKWLLHTWSLSVEWQFYIIYPVVMTIMTKFITLENIKRTILITTILGFIFSLLSSYQWQSASYFLLPSRVWEMMIGGVAYLYPIETNSQKRKIIELLGLILIGLSYLLISKDTYWPGYMSLIPVIGTTLVLLANQEKRSLVNNWLLQKIGLSSYSIYLWHWPIAVALYYFSLNELYIWGGMALSLILGQLSFKYIESLKFRKEFSHWSGYISCKPVLFVIFVVFFTLYHYINPERENVWLKRQTGFIQQTYPIIYNDTPSTLHRDLTMCRFNVPSLKDDIQLRINECYKMFGKGVLIIGDSHAIDLFGLVTSKFNNDFIIGLTQGGCRPHNPDKKCQYEKLSNYLASHQKKFKQIIYEQAGFYLLKDSKGNSGSRSMFNKLGLSESINGITPNVENITIVSSYLASLSNYVPVIWFGSRIEPHIPRHQILRKGCTYEFKLRPKQQDVFQILDDTISKKISTHSNVEFISQNNVLNLIFPQDFMNCQNILWSDGDHLSPYGEEIMGQRLPDDFIKN